MGSTNGKVRATNRFPSSHFPEGWFQIGWSADLAPGTATDLRYFGEDLVLWRGESGDVFVQDAYCLHLGHHRGIRGVVEGEDIVCAWHGWKWDGEGRNVCIPYSSQKCKKNLQIRTYPAREWCGTILAWYSPNGDAPKWEPPVIPEYSSPDFYPMHPYSDHLFKLRGHPQVAMENIVDSWHAIYLHGATNLPEVEFFSEGHHAYSNMSMEYGQGKDGTWLTPEGSRRAVIQGHAYGIGLGVMRWPEELHPTVMISAYTPVDDEHMHYFFQQCSKRGPGETGDEPAGMALRMLKMNMKLVQEDFFTWENMKYLALPSFAVEEAKAWTAFRRWATQFYPAEDAARMIDAGAEQPQPAEA